MKRARATSLSSPSSPSICKRTGNSRNRVSKAGPTSQDVRSRSDASSLASRVLDTRDLISLIRTMSFSVVTRMRVRARAFAASAASSSRLEAMMVAKAVLRDDEAPSDRKLAKNFSGRPMPAKATTARPRSASTASRDPGRSSAPITVSASRGLVDESSAAGPGTADRHQRLHEGPLRRQGRTQWAGRQAESVADAGFGVHRRKGRNPSRARDFASRRP